MDGRHATAGAVSSAYKGMEPVYYKGKDIRRVLPSEIFALERDNERLRVINHQLKEKCETQRVSLAAQKETLISCSQGAEWAKDQSQDLIIRMTKLQQRLHFQLWRSCFLTARAPDEEDQALTCLNQCPRKYENPRYLQNHGAEEVACFSLLSINPPSCLQDNEGTSAFQDSIQSC